MNPFADSGERSPEAGAPRMSYESRQHRFVMLTVSTNIPSRESYRIMPANLPRAARAST